MSGSFPPYDEAAISSMLCSESKSVLQQLTLVDVVDSTNLALRSLPNQQQHAHALLAEQQSSGRGRRGRSWHSPPGCNIYLSLGWAFHTPISTLSALPLAVAVCVARALKRSGLDSAGIKWPNDIQAEGKKLGGILVEMHSTDPELAMATIGIGINVRMPANESSEAAIEQSWTDVSAHLAQPHGNGLRDQLGGRLIDETLKGLGLFARLGFDSFKTDWNSLDTLRNKEVTVLSAVETVSGKAVGISNSGGLLVVCQDDYGDPRLREFFAGDVSVRTKSTQALVKYSL